MNDENLDITAPADVEIGFSLPEEPPEILTEVSKAASEMMTGKLPESVRKQIEQQSAESAAMRGLGIGKSAGALTLRDLGVKSLEYQQAGMSLGAQVGSQLAAYQTESEKLRQNARTTEETLNQQQRTANLAYLAAKTEAEQSGSKIALASAELQSLNMARRLEAENQLITVNAQYAVENINQLMADAAEYFKSANLSAESLIGKYGV